MGCGGSDGGAGKRKRAVASMVDENCVAGSARYNIKPTPCRTAWPLSAGMKCETGTEGATRKFGGVWGSDGGEAGTR